MKIRFCILFIFLLFILCSCSIKTDSFKEELPSFNTFEEIEYLNDNLKYGFNYRLLETKTSEIENYRDLKSELSSKYLERIEYDDVSLLFGKYTYLKDDVLVGLNLTSNFDLLGLTNGIGFNDFFNTKFYERYRSLLICRSENIYYLNLNNFLEIIINFKQFDGNLESISILCDNLTRKVDPVKVDEVFNQIGFNEEVHYLLVVPYVSLEIDGKQISQYFDYYNIFFVCKDRDYSIFGNFNSVYQIDNIYIDGYFDGFYKDKELTDKINSIDEIDKNMTVYGNIKVLNYNISSIVH